MKQADLPGGPVAKTPHFQCRGSGSIPGTRSHVPQRRARMPVIKRPHMSQLRPGTAKSINQSINQNIKQLRLAGFENYQLLQMANNVKLRNLPGKDLI